MTKYRAVQQSYHNNQIVEVGDIVEFPDDAKVHTNYELADRNAKVKAPAKPAEDQADKLVDAARLHAATRGAPPNETSEFDLDEVCKVWIPPPAPETVKLAAAKLNVTLGSSVA